MDSGGVTGGWLPQAQLVSANPMAQHKTLDFHDMTIGFLSGANRLRQQVEAGPRNDARRH
jgi:hypothetical protein